MYFSNGPLVEALAASRSAIRKRKPVEPSEEDRKVLAQMLDSVLDPDPAKLKSNVTSVKQKNKSSTIRRLLDLLIERTLDDPSSLSAQALLNFGYEAVRPLTRVFYRAPDPVAQEVVARTIAGLVPNLTTARCQRLRVQMIFWVAHAASDSARSAIAVALTALRERLESSHRGQVHPQESSAPGSCSRRRRRR